jgi:S-(hydroxymethyl)glutathione dehydrogenase/alcohol dehydrogenase
VVDEGVVLGARDAVALEAIRVADPGPGEVRVRIEASGVCHSDLHVIEEDGWHHPYPVLLGHEGAGPSTSSATAWAGLHRATAW